MEKAVNEIFTCYKCDKQLFGEAFEGQLAGVNWKNNRMFVAEATDNAYMFCDRHVDKALKAWKMTSGESLAE